MRDSNYKSIALNKAAVSITTNLYDRRALDSTSDRPLVNSLNHLTFLTSSSAKVRETLSTDGGLERLVSILHECKKSPQDLISNNGKKSIAQEKNDAIIAWKWTLAFQCLVLVGTRGTEKIRKRVVEAGIVPIIATVLDNYLLVVRNFDNNIDNNLSESFLNLVQNQSKFGNHECDDMKNIDDDTDLEIRNYLNSNSELYNYLNEHHSEVHQNSSNSSASTSSSIHVIRNINEFNIPQNLQDINQTITSPRFFLNGILIPKEDDVVWSLQLLAFISKYSNLKDFLQFTHLVDPLSLRSLLNNNNNLTQASSIPPPLENDDLDNEMEYELISNFSSDENDQRQQQQSQQQNQQQQSQQQQQNHQYQQASQVGSSQRQEEISNTQTSLESSQIQPATQPDTQRPSTQSSQSQILIQNSNGSNDNIITDNDELLSGGASKPDLTPLINLYSQSNSIPNELKPTSGKINNKSCFTKSLLNSILKFENCCLQKCSPENSTSTDEEKTMNLIELTIKLNKFYQRKASICKLNKIKQNISKREKYEEKWDYNTYFSNPQNLQPQADFDTSTLITQHLNIFPLVEKFTIKSLNSIDMCYWSGVIMRNSCRKDENRGGVRQCACFDCGKWENFPRQFAKCRRCKRTKYCSKECQLKAWVYHKHWCVDSNSTSSGTGTNGGSTRNRDDGTSGNGAPAVGTGTTTTAGATTQLTENLNI